MKKFFIIATIFFITTTFGHSKILNIENNVRINVPSEYYYLNVQDIKNYKSFLGEDFGKFLEQSDINFYILGNPNVINFFEKSFSGKNMEKEDWVIELTEKIEKKAKKTKSRKTLIEYSKKQLKKIMIDNKLTSWTMVFVSNQSFRNDDSFDFFDISKNDLIEALSELGISNSLDNLNDIEKTDLRKIQREVNNSINQNSKYIVNEFMTYKFSPLILSKDKSNDLFLSGKTKILFSMWDQLRLSYNGKYYFTFKNNKIFGIYQECIYICGGFSKEFKKMTNPIFNNSFKKIENTKKKSNLNDRNLVENLQKLIDLYEAGILTKDEFEKAKKKLLN